MTDLQHISGLPGVADYKTARTTASTEPIGVDISDFSDEWCAGFLKGQVNALEEVADPALRDCDEEVGRLKAELAAVREALGGPDGPCTVENIGGRMKEAERLGYDCGVQHQEWEIGRLRTEVDTLRGAVLEADRIISTPKKELAAEVKRLRGWVDKIMASNEKLEWLRDYEAKKARVAKLEQKVEDANVQLALAKGYFIAHAEAHSPSCACAKCRGLSDTPAAHPDHKEIIPWVPPEERQEGETAEQAGRRWRKEHPEGEPHTIPPESEWGPTDENDPAFRFHPHPDAEGD